MNLEAGLAGIAVLLVLLVLRLPVALALMAVSVGGTAWMLGWTPAFGILSSTPYGFASNWTLSAVPMFLLMGFVAYHSGLTTGLFNAAKAVFRVIPGGLAISSVFACSGFAAVCGSSLACAAAMGRIAIPEMVRAGYKPSFACGALAAGGTIGALIPPSILMIVYGVFAETSITQVFLGGITVGIVTAIGYSIVILLVAWLRPDIIPARAIAGEALSIRKALAEIWPLIVLGFLVFGGLFGGFFTATEAGAIGATGAIIIAWASGRLGWAELRRSLLETLSTSSGLFIIGVGAAMFTRFLGISGAGAFIASSVNGLDLSFFGLMAIVVLVYLFLGMFMEPFGAMLVTLPVFLPVFARIDIDLVWFGVLLTKLLEIGMITPPLGMNVFVIRGVASRYASLADIFRGVSVFLVADLFIVALVIVWPDMVLYLPSLGK